MRKIEIGIELETDKLERIKENFSEFVKEYPPDKAKGKSITTIAVIGVSSKKIITVEHHHVEQLRRANQEELVQVCKTIGISFRQLACLVAHVSEAAKEPPSSIQSLKEAALQLKTTTERKRKRTSFINEEQKRMQKRHYHKNKW